MVLRYRRKEEKLKKRIVTIFSVGIIALSITACGKSSGDSSEITKKLDFDIIQENLDTAFKNSETYSMYNSCDIEYDSDGNDLNIIVAVNDSIDPSLSVDYAKYAISTINYEAQRQVEGLKDYSNSDNYYGGLFDDVDAFITVAPVSASNEDDYFIFESIPRGSNREIKLH